jgi:hypothetical protein
MDLLLVLDVFSPSTAFVVIGGILILVSLASKIYI